MKKTTSKATIKAPVNSNSKAVPKIKYKLPTGEYTSSVKKYLKEWKTTGEKFGNIIGGNLSAFDPTFYYTFAGSRNGETFNPSIVLKILTYIDEKENEFFQYRENMDSLKYLLT